MNNPSTCQLCGVSFYPDKDWKKVCLPCYKKMKQRENSELTRLRQENESLHSQLASALTRVAIPKDIQRLLIQLCHPDKHGGSPASNKATEWLLSQRCRHD